MYRILIVEDEIGIVEGLKLIIKRGLPNCIVEEVAYNGHEGYKFAIEKKPNIILTDIRMPQADGLEMISRLKDSGCNSKYIVLSGHSEFEYARKAIALGVEFYINKPVEEEELYEVVNKVCLDIDTEQAKVLEIQNLEHIIENNLKSIREFVLRDILVSAGDNSESIRFLLESCGYPISHKQYVCVLLHSDAVLSALDENAFREIAIGIKVVLRNLSNIDILRFSDTQIVVIISNNETIDYKRLAKSVYCIKERLAKEIGRITTAGIGLVYESVAGISKSFEEAWQALSYKMIRGVGSLILYPETKNNTKNHSTVSEEDIRILETHIDNADIQGCSNIIDAIFNKMSNDKKLRLDDIKSQCLNILLSGIRKMSVTQVQLNEFIGENIMSLGSFSRFKTLKQLKDWLINTIKIIIELKMADKKIITKDTITKVKEYLKEHYSDNINLSELSEKFYINPYYLSHLFKEKTGDTYLSFLTNIRINKAMELLKETDFRIYEICEMVGYSDVNYFSKLFDKFVGFKPSKFRKNHLEDG